MAIENYWPKIKQLIPSYFKDITVKPSLLHGDLWLGNSARWLKRPG